MLLHSILFQLRPKHIRGLFVPSSFGEDDDDGESDDSSASGVDDSSESDDPDRMYETIYYIYLLILLCRYNYKINNGGL